MADYTTPPWSQLVAGKPWTDEKAAAAFENPIAIAEGAEGAPRLHIGALQRLEAGEEIRSRIDGGVSGSATILGHSFSFCQVGHIRVKFGHRSPNGGFARVIRVRNGVNEVISTFVNSSGWNYESVDVGVLPGDRVFITNATGGSGGEAHLELQRFCTNGQDLWPGVECMLEGNRYT